MNPLARLSAVFGLVREYRRAAAFHRSGDFAEAARCCREALRVSPDYFEALHLLGLLEAKLGRPDEAHRLLTRAVEINPRSAEANGNLGNVQSVLGRPGEALASCDRALAIKPDLVEALNTRGAALNALDRHEEAIASLERALALRPDYAEALHNRGSALQRLQRYEAALASFDQALALAPDHADALNDRGVALSALERHAEALASFEEALARKPVFAEALHNRGIALMDLERLDEALASLDRALAIHPDFAEALNHRGMVCRDLGDYPGALASYDRAVAIRPDFAEALNNRGAIQLMLRRCTGALASFDRALAVKADFATALINRGLVLREFQRFPEALASFDLALAIKSDDVATLQTRASVLSDLGKHEEAIVVLQQVLGLDAELPQAKAALLHETRMCCDWRNFDAAMQEVIADVRAGKPGANPFNFLAASDSLRDQLRCAQTWVRTECPPSPLALWQGERYRHQRIRIAYLSPDFRDHAMSHLIAGLIERHDSARFEVTGIAFGPVSDGEMAKRMQAAFEHYVDVRAMSDREVAGLLRDREIDIAVDLGGYTTFCRSGIVALRPAPVQVNYMGFPGTMAAEYIDYIVADEVVIPPEDHPWYTESVVRLPDTYQANDSRRRIARRTPTRAESGLPETGFVFCSFNNSYKITPAVFDTWMRLLRRVDGSVLWLLAGNPAVPRNLRREAADRGVAPERLVFAKNIRHDEHLARQRLADLFLDTLPYNAHTTASDALWAGLPVLTCTGTTFAGRVAASLLRAVGLPELVAGSSAEYEALALQLANDAPRLAGIRAKLARNRDSYPLFDTDRFRRHMEAAYLQMWERAERGEPPTGFAVAPTA